MTTSSNLPRANINPLYFIEAGGEMGRLIRKKDWSTTCLGPPQTWPQSLKTMVKMLLDNPFGMYIAWGNEYIQLYNDGYRPILGTHKHPNALGKSTSQTFGESYDIIKPMFDGVMQGKAICSIDFLLPINRNGFLEECYFDFSYSPIRLEDGQVGGVLVTVIETTNKKKAGLALKNSEERFRTMADNIAQLAWMADETGSIFWYNKRWLEYTGKPFEELKGRGWKKIHHPEYGEKVIVKFERAMKEGQPWEDTFPLLGADGNYRWFLSQAFPIKDGNDHVLQWFGTNTDVTKQMETQLALKESEQLFRTMAEATGVLITITNDRANGIFFNKAWTEFSGLPIEELLNMGWLKIIDESYRERYLASFRELFAQKKPFNGEFRVLNKKNQQRWLYAQATPRFSADGSFADFISSAVDITERKEVEWRIQEKERNLRNIIVQAPVAMCILKGKNMVVELANELMFDVWGKPKSAMVGKPLFEGLSEIKGSDIQYKMGEVYQTGEVYRGGESAITIVRHGKPAPMFFNYVLEPYREISGGDITGIFIVAIDITAHVLARQKIEEVVAQRTKALEEANIVLLKSNEELSQFAYIASHDLQEPLRKISTFSQMLENNLGEEIDEKGKNFLTKINNAARRMSNLIKDVLLYSLVVKDSQVFEKVDLNDIVRNVIVDFELMIEQKHADVKVEPMPVLPAIALQMTQLFGNVIGNALKFSRSDATPQIFITATATNMHEKTTLELNTELEYCKIIVADNGIGFKMEHADQIFNIFQRLHRNSEYEGTGIGLSICKKIAINHGGMLTATGSSEAGAVFNIFLPKSKR